MKVERTETQIKAEPVVNEAKPDIKTAPPTVPEFAESVQVDRISSESVKPLPKIRDFAAVGREDLIGELVVAVRDEARAWTGEGLSYRQEKRLAKLYRTSSDKKPTDGQISSLDALRERFDKPLPQPKTFIEAAILRFDNITDAEKSAAMRKHIALINSSIEREESRKIQSAGVAGRAGEYHIFGQPENSFADGLRRLKTDLPRTKSYYQMEEEARQRNLTLPYNFNEKIQEQQTQMDVYQMNLANAFQEQIKRSLEEQGIKLEPLVQQFLNAEVDRWAKQPPTAEEFTIVQGINQSSNENGNNNFTPKTGLEAKARIFAAGEERERDKFAASLASEAEEKVAALKQRQTQEMRYKDDLVQDDSLDKVRKPLTQKLRG